MYHYRDYTHSEIDLVLEGPGNDLVAIEIKSTETISDEDFKELKKFQNKVGKKLKHGILFYSGNMILPFGEKLTAMPISSLWE